jgi:RNA polymerase sigma factor (sigma-70 family)
MEIPMKQLKELRLNAASALPMHSLDAPFSLDPSGATADNSNSATATLIDQLPDRSSGDVELAALEASIVLADAIESLSDREQQVFHLYYREGFTLLEIAKIYGVTESRACQIRARVERKLIAFINKKKHHEYEPEEWQMPEPVHQTA